ncbi:hypothetical protein Tco_1348527, partial [Tanacetum coccineum]
EPYLECSIAFLLNRFAEMRI